MFKKLLCCLVLLCGALALKANAQDGLGGIPDPVMIRQTSSRTFDVQGTTAALETLVPADAKPVAMSNSVSKALEELNDRLFDGGIPSGFLLVVDFRSNGHGSKTVATYLVADTGQTGTWHESAVGRSATINLVRDKL